jgi:hypothetical protein
LLIRVNFGVRSNTEARANAAANRETFGAHRLAITRADFLIA